MTRERLLRPKEVAQFGIAAVQTLARWRCEGKGPPFIKLGRQVRYPAELLQGWIEKESNPHNYPPQIINNIFWMRLL